MREREREREMVVGKRRRGKKIWNNALLKKGMGGLDRLRCTRKIRIKTRNAE